MNMNELDVQKISLAPNEYLMCKLDPKKWSPEGIQQFVDNLPQELLARSYIIVGDVEFTKVEKKDSTNG